MQYTRITKNKTLRPILTKIFATGLVMATATSTFALESNRKSEHMAENASVGAYSYLDVGNLTNKKVHIETIYYQLEGSQWAEFTNTWGDGFDLSPGEWSRDCDEILEDNCYFKGASFTNVGWGMTYTWTSNYPITNHSWKVKYKCEGDSKTRLVMQHVYHDRYWAEAVITDCVNDETKYSSIKNDGTAMEEFMENSPYNTVTDGFIVSDFIDRDDPDGNGDYESWYGVTSSDTSSDAIADMDSLKDVAPVLIRCEDTEGNTAKELGIVLAENSIANGCHCDNDDQADDTQCPDLGAVYYWALPDHLIGNIDTIGGDISDEITKSLYQNKLMQVRTSNISGGDSLKEGTRLRLHVNLDGEQVSQPADYVVVAGRQDQWTYAVDFAKTVNNNHEVPVSVGERFPDGSIVARGSSYRNWVWGKEDYDVTIERADPEYIDVLRGGHLSKGTVVNLEVKNPSTGEKYRFSYQVPSESSGKNWRWPAYFGNAINAEAEANNYPVRVGEYGSNGQVTTIGSSYRNKVWVGTNEPGNWMVTIETLQR